MIYIYIYVTENPNNTSFIEISICTADEYIHNRGLLQRRTESYCTYINCNNICKIRTFWYSFVVETASCWKVFTYNIYIIYRNDASYNEFTCNSLPK